MPSLLPKTSRELQQIIADQSGLPLSAIKVYKLGDDGDFGAMVAAFTTAVSGEAYQSNIETICDHLRLKYRLKD